MDQAETLALYARAEAARAAAKEAGEDRHGAHAAATAVWNGWADDMLAKRKALEDAGTWAATISINRNFEPQNDQTRAWLKAASTVFSTSDSKHIFEQDVDCRGWTFPGVAGFSEATFTGDARFGGATFTGAARFEGATFTGNAWFEGATFTGDAWFAGATFTGDAWFALAKFNGYTTFERAKFRADASFLAIKGETAFTMEGARFDRVPDFIQANFWQAPRLDNVMVRPRLAAPLPEATRLRRAVTWPGRFIHGLVKRLFWGDRTIPARYRALKRLAIQGHDLEREQMFHAGEIRSARFSTDWPLHYKLWSGAAFMSVWRFWLGLAYDLLSDFGRSVLRPLALWAALLVFSFAVYLGAHPDVARERAAMLAGSPGLAAVPLAYLNTAWTARQRNQPCTSGGAGIKPLPEAVRAATSAVSEAWHLALANGAVLGDVGSPDTGSRTYGCLYGIADIGPDGPRLSLTPYPAVVSEMAKWQKALSALLIFLFGLAVRNMLRMK